MFLLKNKIDKNLSYYLKHNSYKKYRVLIKCNTLRDNIVKKIHTYKGDVLYSLEYCNIICCEHCFQQYIDTVREVVVVTVFEKPGFIGEKTC